MPKVSICIPTYNQVEYLKKCIQSVLTQDYLDYEIIISDDSSTNEVKDYIDSLKGTNVIHYYKNSPSLGTPQNWNFAISKASGDYIKVLHHDDFFNQTNSLGLFVQALDKNPSSDFAFSATLVWHVNTNSKNVHTCSSPNLDKIKSDPECLFFGNLIGAPSATIYRRALAVKFDKQLKWLVDVDFYISALKRNCKVIYIDAPLICTAHGTEGQVTGQVEHDKAIQIKEHILVLKKIIAKEKFKIPYHKLIEELFLQYCIKTKKDIEEYVKITANLNVFLNEVLNGVNSFKTLKKIKYRLLNSKYNKRYFKIKKY